MTPAFPPQRADSVLFVTLDSCRYDTFAAAAAPHLKSLGPLHRAMAPATFTYGSHMAMFMGFTPGVAGVREPYVNPKFGKIFRMTGGGLAGPGGQWAMLQGRNIVDGFRNRGHRTIGCAAMSWFNHTKPTAQGLTAEFERFWYSGNAYSLGRQLEWLAAELASVPAEQPAFVFLNVGETHVPYFHEGADWDRQFNPCKAFAETNDAVECRRRQLACAEFIDVQIAPLLEAFAGANTVVCGDHGDCWGENGLWEHGIHHEKTLEVPLLFRLGPALG